MTLELNKLNLFSLFIGFTIITYPVLVIFDYSKLFYIITLILIFLGFIFLKKTRNKTVLKYSTPLFIFSFLCFISFVWALDPELTIRKSIAFISMLLIALTVTNFHVYIKNYIEWLALTMAVTISFIFIYLFFTYGTIRLISYELENISTTISNSNAALLVLIIPILMAAIVDSKNKIKKIIFIFGLLLSFTSIVLSQSRGAYFLTIIGLITFVAFYHSPKTGKRQNIKKIFYISLLLLLAFPFITQIQLDNEIIQPVIERIENSSFINSSGQVDELRGNMLTSIFKILSNTPFTGIGYENYPIFSENEYGIYEFSHNLFLSATEVGLFGILLWLFIIPTALFRAHKTYIKCNSYQKNKNLVILIALTLGIIHSFFRPQLQNIFFIIILSISLLPSKSRLKLL